MTKRCPVCTQHRDLSRFQNDSSRRDGKDGLCKVCRRAYRQKRKHLEHARRKAWAVQHPAIEHARAVSRQAYPKAKQCAVETCDQLGERHHLDYGRPLEVLFLCKSHHALLHAVARLIA